MLFKKQPSISHLEPFGSYYYIHILEEKRSSSSKLQPRAEREIFIGYSESPNIYKVQLLNKQIFMVHAKNCTFVQPLIQPLVQSPIQPLVQPFVQLLVQSLVQPLIQSQLVQTQPAPVNKSFNQPSIISHSSSVAPPNPTNQLIDQSADSDDKQHSSTLLATALAVNECEPMTFKQATSCADAPR